MLKFGITSLLLLVGIAAAAILAPCAYAQQSGNDGNINCN